MRRPGRPARHAGRPYRPAQRAGRVRAGPGQRQRRLRPALPPRDRARHPQPALRRRARPARQDADPPQPDRADAGRLPEYTGIARDRQPRTPQHLRSHLAPGPGSRARGHAHAPVQQPRTATPRARPGRTSRPGNSPTGIGLRLSAFTIGRAAGQVIRHPTSWRIRHLRDACGHPQVRCPPPLPPARRTG